ncbi:MAG: UvrD-helicase domain-containing protein [Clostridia bacterium]|nr:UvrD-helicase domain-containing protein [Clostridia bacterium]
MFIADFHIHSKYSIATSKDCVVEVLDLWGRRKGIAVIGTGDFTHRAWREELKEKLVPTGEGLYTVKDNYRLEDEVAGANFKPRFIVSGEISSIYKKNGRVRKVHNLILLPSLEHAELISQRLEAIGNLHSDGRPILGLDSRDLLEIVLESCPEAIFIPAHIWTPHFSLYGAHSGFDDIEECYEDLTGHIFALETGLSSDPPMNWRLSALDDYTLVSNSDAHSPANLGREANIFATHLSYQGIFKALKNRNSEEFYGTIEFFPEEGKYHYDGHRACKVCWKPAATRAAGGICPVCGGKITVGVLHRVETLADREEGFVPLTAKHYESLVPLREVIAASIGYSVASKKVREMYADLLRGLGPELVILRETPLNDIELAAGPCLAEGIRRLRAGKVRVEPGFDGQYGKITILTKSEIEKLSGQLCFFNNLLQTKRGKKDSTREAALKPPLAATRSPEEAVENVAPDFPYGLNQQQWEAVSSPSPAIAVIAGPGTGKTKTLISRIAYLIEECGVQPSQVTAVTFTNKAANEMRVRLENHFGDRAITKAMTIGTFHSICLQILSARQGRDNIIIIDENHAVAIVADILKAMGLKISPREARRRISLRKSGTITPVADEKQGAIEAEIYAQYCSQLKRYGLMDYDDILLEMLKRFAADNNTGNITEETFSYLLVDEFQDINDVQYRLIKEWGRKSKGIFIIGDPDQSIYGFRGSDFHYFERFKEDFPGVSCIKLIHNYRSTPEIIACAQAIIAEDTAGRPSRSLEAKREKGARVRLVECSDDFSQALFIAREINRMVGGIDMLAAHTLAASQKRKHGPRGFNDIAVLYRTNRQADVLETCLGKEGIPYRVAGRDEFLAEKPVREAIAFFSLLLNPGDIASLLLFLKADNMHTADLKEMVLERYLAGEKSISSLIKLLEGIEPPLTLGAGSPHLVELLRKYEPVIHKEKPWQIINGWINDHSLTGFRCMELLLNTAVMYDRMDSFIQTLRWGSESEVVRSGSKVYSPEAVTLMTIHAAKGLEFPVVFIYGVNDGLIPLKNSKFHLDLDEERRLFYVGVTRARDELLLLTSGTPSPFIAGIAKENLVSESVGLPKQGLQYKQMSFFD